VKHVKFESHQSLALPGFRLSLGLLAAGLFFLAGMVGCSSKQAAVPTAFIQDFLSKHETMVDSSLADFYVKEEQTRVAQQINESIASRKAAGTLESLQHATFDFRDMKIELIDEKEEYVDDAPAVFLKVGTHGSFIMNMDEGTQTVPAENILILEKVGSNWKVTENLNPWG
jgi:hypothetical protein